jgi:two-component sensor histidine kinase
MRSLLFGKLAPGSFAAYGFAVAIVALATTLHFLIAMEWPNAVPFALYYAAVQAAALVAGWQAGLFALVLGGVLGWSTTTDSSYASASLVIYTIAALAVVGIAHHYRRLIGRVQRRHNELQLLTGELDHRLRNTFGLVQATVSQVLRDDKATAERVNSRVLALMHANEILLKARAGHVVSLTEILAAELSLGGERATFFGPSVSLPEQLVVPLTMVFHELTINALKHGSLSGETGTVEVTWERDESRLAVHWRERDGPPAAAPARKGFGTHVLDHALQALGGTVIRQYERIGLTCDIGLTVPRPRRNTSSIIERDQTTISAEPP